jgi:anti-sigma factor (TIGR02949 family)
MDKDDCADVFARLSEYLDQELPDMSCEAIEQHIAGCAPCVEFVESLRKSIQMTRGFSAEEQPSPLPDELKEQLRSLFARNRGLR